MAKNDNILTAALDYLTRGWSIIPVCPGTKKPAVKWAPYQKVPADDTQIRKWFADSSNGVAVICGSVSGGLTCRDFDDPTAYDRWAAECPELAKTLPTVKTSRGFHVYFVSGLDEIQHLPDNTGELRGAGCCLLPPSTHPDGPQYRWIIEPNGELPKIDPTSFSGHDKVTDCTEKQRSREPEKQKQQKQYVKGSYCNDDFINTAINNTLPAAGGQRNRKIFDFARVLKSNPALTEANACDLRGYVQQWHELALPFIGTKPLFETLIDFEYAWEKIQYLIGENPMLVLKTKVDAGEIEPPQVVIERWPMPDARPLHLLAGVCKELQAMRPNAPFWISCRTAGQLVGVSHRTASKLLFLLEREGVIKKITKGDTRRAPRFVYLI